MRISDALPPALWAPPTHRRFLAKVGAVVVAVALLATAAGWVLAGETRRAPLPPGPARVVDLGPALVATPATWRPVSVVPGFGRMDGLRAAGFHPAPGLPAQAVVTLTPVRSPSLVPAIVEKQLAGPLPEPKRVQLHGRAAWQYVEMPTATGGLMDLVVVPTSAGVLTVACIAARSAWSAAVGCASDLEAIALRGAQWLTPADDLALRLAAPAVLERLGRERREGRAALRRAGTRRGQARAAARLRAAHTGAAAALTPLAPESGGPTVVAALNRAGEAYGRLAAAARAGVRPRYARARGRLKAADAALTRSVSRLPPAS